MNLERHFRYRVPFFVQADSRAVWHVESPDDPEVMLCGEVIPVGSATMKMRQGWGTKPCLWCKKTLDEATGGRYSR